MKILLLRQEPFCFILMQDYGASETTGVTDHTPAQSPAAECHSDRQRRPPTTLQCGQRSRPWLTGSPPNRAVLWGSAATRDWHSWRTPQQ